MKRYRTLKRDFWGDDERVPLVSRDARLLFLGMISHADDHGLLSALPLKLKGQVFCYDEVTYGQIVAWLIELHDVGLVKLYGSPEKPYAHIVSFQRHQVQRTIQPPTCPTPGSRNSAGFQAGDLQAFTALHSSKTEMDEANAARKVREGKVREGDVGRLMPNDDAERDTETLPAQVNAPTAASRFIEQAIDIFVECSTGGIDESMWRSQIEMHRTRHLGAPAERYVDAAMQMRAKWQESKRPFNLSSGWSWFEKAWRSLAADEHEGQRRAGHAPAERKGRSADDLIAQQNAIWGEAS